MSLIHPVVADESQVAALRAAFRHADKMTRRALVPILPPTEVQFAGVTLFVDPRDNYTDRMIWRDGQPPEMRSLTALVEIIEGRNAFVLDVGANSGAYTVPIAVAAGAGSRVLAFEPAPAMIARLGHNLRLNDVGDRVRIEGCALGTAPGEATLHFRRRNYGQASLLPIKPGLSAGTSLVPMRCLTDFVGEAVGHDVSVLKMDVEGAEAMVLAPLLAADDWWPDAILIETAHAENWNIDVMSELTARGYKAVFKAERNTLLIKQGGAA